MKYQEVLFYTKKVVNRLRELNAGEGGVKGGERGEGERWEGGEGERGEGGERWEGGEGERWEGGGDAIPMRDWELA